MCKLFDTQIIIRGTGQNNRNAPSPRTDTPAWADICGANGAEPMMPGSDMKRYPPLPSGGLSQAPGRAIYGVAACTIFLAVSMPIAWYGRDQRSAWTLASFPGDPDNSHVPVLGYSILLGDRLFMDENQHVAHQVAFFGGFNGSAQCQSFYTIRAFYGVLTTFLAPLLGVFGAALAVNWLAWALCAWVAWRLAILLIDDPLAGLLAVVFVSGGTGMIVHIGDYSAHLLAHASYYLGVYLLYISGVAFARQPLRTHLFLGSYLAVACLVYNTGLMLTAIYLLVGWRHNSRLHLAGAIVVALSARPLWQITLPLLGAQIADAEVDAPSGHRRSGSKCGTPSRSTPQPSVGRCARCRA